MITLTSPNGNGACTLAPADGGRIESLAIRRAVGGEPIETELMVTRNSLAEAVTDQFSWGCFTMVPFCGRVRHGELVFRGNSHRLEPRLGPHAIHGTVVDRPWVVLQLTSTNALLGCDLGPRWPFAGMVHHEITIDDHGLSMTLTLSADEPMPVQVGWHPWFRRPDHYSLPFAAFLERDSDGIATVRRVALAESDRGRYDDCFVGVEGPIALRFGDIALSLESDCSHWTVFDQPAHGICIEPQSGPPNGVNDCPDVLAADDQLSRWFRINWDIGPDN